MNTIYTYKATGTGAAPAGIQLVLGPPTATSPPPLRAARAKWWRRFPLAHPGMGRPWDRKCLDLRVPELHALMAARMGGAGPSDSSSPARPGDDESRHLASTTPAARLLRKQRGCTQPPTT